MLVKKVLIIVFVLICLLGFTACDPAAGGIDGDEVLSNTVKIELVQYENEDPKLLYDSRMKESVFDFSKATTIATLDEDCFEDVVTDIASQEMLIFNRTLNEPIGKTLILYQKDGSMIVLFGCVYEEKGRITRYYGDCNVYDENGAFVACIGDIGSDYVDILVEKYF